MAGLRFTELQSRPMEFLDFTSLTLDEFQQLVPPFEAAFHARMAAWRMDGKPRIARRFTVYKNCPLPTPEDRLLFEFIPIYGPQCLRDKAAPALARGPCTGPAGPPACLALTRIPVDEVQHLVPSFEAALHAQR